MAYYSLSPSLLRWYIVGGQTNWASEIHNYNMTRLNNSLLKLNVLDDVNTSGLGNGDILRYNSSSQEWEPYTLPSGYHLISTTTTTTTTTTSTSTTTTT
jgi:hypothetical protein